jgi:DNA-binding SARP family transcriptional activator
MGAVDIRVGVLGSLRVHVGGVPVTVPGQRCSIVLAALALSAGRLVTTQSLIEDVWGEQLPQSATSSLHNLVARLRRVVGADAIRTVPAGYVLDVDPEQVDALRFRRLVGDAARSREPAKARVLLAEALSLWDGEPLAAVASERLRRDVAPRLAEELLAAAERRIDLDLAAGQCEDLIPELRDLTSRYPLRETLWRQLIVALDVAGRRADALNAYHELRTELSEQIGVEPGAELRGLYQSLLKESTDVGSESGGDAESTAQPRQFVQPGRDDLPADTADFTGRSQELERLLATAAGPENASASITISLIDGMAGIGKTTLAVRLAHRLAEHYPDGRLFIDLRGHTPGDEPMDSAAALGDLLRALGLSGDHLPEELSRRAALWRTQLAGRRVLVVLDNASSASQVRPLIPGSAGCLAIVTSRRRIADLDGAHVLSLDAFPEDDASALFAAIAGADRCAAEPEALADVLEACGYLPLGLRIAAARLRSRPAWSVRHLANRLADERHRLAELAAGERSVAAAFALSYEQLTPAQQRAFRLIGLHPGTFADVHLTAALVGVDLREAETLLEDLVDAHLLQQPTAGHYQFHDLLRQYARAMLERDEPAPATDEAVRRMLDYYSAATAHVSSYFAISNASESADARLQYQLPAFESDREAFDWYEEQHANLLAIIAYAKDNGYGEYLCSWLNAVWWFLRMRGHLAEWIDAQTVATDAAARLMDPHTAADMHRLLGMALWESERYGDAMTHYRRAVDLYTDTNDVGFRARTESNLAFVCYRLGHYEQALELFERALRDNRDAEGSPTPDTDDGDDGDDGLSSGTLIEASILAGFGYVYQAIGRHADALAPARESLALFERVRDFLAQGQAHSLLGRVLASTAAESAEPEQAATALEHHREALSIIRECEARASETEALNAFGDTLRTLGRPAEAREQYESALALAMQLNLRYEQARAHDGIAGTFRASDNARSSFHHDKARALFAAVGVEPPIATGSDPVAFAEPGPEAD